MNPLRRHRIDAGLTLTQLAVQTGISKQRISAVELGGGMNPADLKTLADFLSAQLEREISASSLLAVNEAAA